MGQPHIGEIRMFGGNFAPVGWAFCDGQLMPIAENDTLYALIGTTYGGDGQATFGIPNLQSRVPIHSGQGPGLSQNYVLGQTGGVEQVTLTTQQIPSHNHAYIVSTDSAASTAPAGQMPGNSPSVDIYIESGTAAQFSNQALSQVGGSQPHSNIQPYLTVSFIISLFGIFPSQN